MTAAAFQIPAQDIEEVFAHILRHGRPMILVSDIADWLNVSKGHIYNLCDDRHLEEHNLRGPRRVTRRSLIKFLLETANYKPADAETFIKVLLLLLDDLNAAGLGLVQQRVARLIEQRSPRGLTPMLPFLEASGQKSEARGQ